MTHFIDTDGGYVYYSECLVTGNCSRRRPDGPMRLDTDGFEFYLVGDRCLMIEPSGWIEWEDYNERGMVEHIAFEIRLIKMAEQGLDATAVLAGEMGILSVPSLNLTAPMTPKKINREVG